MAAQKWQLHKENGNIVLENGTEVFDTDNINPEALQDLCDDWNSGLSNEKIKSNLEKDERLTGDEVDYIMEQIEGWIEQQETTILQEVITNNMDAVQTLRQGVEDELNKSTEKKQRKPRQVKPQVANGNSKTVSAEDYIAQLQEKIELVKIIGSLKLELEMPQNISTKGKNLLLEVEKSINSTVAAYLQQVQTM